MTNKLDFFLSAEVECLRTLVRNRKYRTVYMFLKILLASNKTISLTVANML